MTLGGNFLRTTLRISGGIIVWAVHFAIIYGYTGLACARRYGSTADNWLSGVPWVIGVSTLLGVAACGVLMLQGFRARKPEDFTPWMGAWIAVLSAVAILLEGAGILYLPICT